MFRFRFLPLYISFALSGCGVIGKKVDYYDYSSVAKEANVATITGSKTKRAHYLSPVLLYVHGIDNQSMGRNKKARCGLDKPIPLLPGPHELLVTVSIGEPFAYSRYGVATLAINAMPNAELTLKGEPDSKFSATVWVEDSQGNLTSEKIPVTLKDSPAKAMPLGYALIDDSCSMP